MIAESGLVGAAGCAWEEVSVTESGEDILYRVTRSLLLLSK